MRVTRRRMLGMGGGLAAALSLMPVTARAADPVEVIMGGRPDGSHVWFDPIGLLIEPGQTIRWINKDAGNSHTATAYHPANFGRPRRIPEAAAPWDTDYLLPGEAFAITLMEPGVYDYFCAPHEEAGMVGRIIVGSPRPQGWMNIAGIDDGVPETALRAFPSVEEIMTRRIVRRA